MKRTVGTSWLILHVKLFLRNVLFALNALFCLSVLYFSISEDKQADILSYVAALLVVLTIKYAFREMRNITLSFSYLINILSKIQILVGISLLIFPQFWNTAFYSICLGIVIQKVNYEIDLRTGKDDAQKLKDDTKLESFGEDLQKELLKQYNRSESLSFEENTNIQRNNLIEQDESSVKIVENLPESKTESHYLRDEDIKLQTFNRPHLALIESSKIELNGANIELKQLEENCDTSENIIFNRETLSEDKFPETDSKEFHTINRRECMNEPKNMKNKQINIYSYVSHAQEVVPQSILTGLFDYRNLSCQQNQREIKQKCNMGSESSFKDGMHLHLLNNETKDSENINMNIQNGCNIMNNKNTVIDQEMSFINKSPTKQNLCTTFRNSQFKTEYSSENCTLMKSIDKKFEKKMRSSQIIHEKTEINDGNSNAFANCSVSKTSCLTTYIKDDLIKRNDSENIDKKRKEVNELATNALTDTDKTNFPDVSDFDGAVNRIDLGFIYALGFNVPYY